MPFGRFTHVRVADGSELSCEEAAAAYAANPPGGIPTDELHPRPSEPVTLEEAERSGEVQVLASGDRLHESMMTRQLTKAGGLKTQSRNCCNLLAWG